MADFDKFTAGVAGVALLLGFLLGSNMVEDSAGSDQASQLREIAAEMESIEDWACQYTDGDLEDVLRSLNGYAEYLPGEYDDALSALQRYHEEMRSLQGDIEQMAQDIESYLEND